MKTKLSTLKMQFPNLALSFMLVSCVAQASIGAELKAGAPVEPSQSQALSASLADSSGRSENSASKIGTGVLQEKVLMQINDGLVKGWLTPEESSRFKADLDKINEQESWYKSTGSEVPNSVIGQNNALLEQLSKRLTPKPVPSIATLRTHDASLDEMVSVALAKNRITSSEAESYYLRLAQIESTVVSTSCTENQACSVDKDLRAIKSELLRKAN